MAYERQRALRDELNRRYPKLKNNIGQQMFRSAYFNHRMAGDSHESAREGSITAVRVHVPAFSPIENAG